MRWLLALPLAVLVAYSAFSAFKYTRLISNIFFGLVYRPSAPPPPSARGESLVILDSSAREIRALAVDAADAGTTVIFCHESGAGKESWEKYASFLPKQGCRVLSVDFSEKNDGEGPNPLSQWPDEDDVQRLLTVMRWAKKAYPSSPRLVLFGVSKGANIALAASSRASGPCAVVADGLFSMKEIFRDYIRRWAPVLVKPNLFGEHYPDWVVNIFTELGFWHCQRRSGKRFIDVERLLRRRTCLPAGRQAPLLMIHGGTDDYVPPSHQRFLRRRAADGRHWTAPEAGHNEAVLLLPELYQKEVSDFLQKAFG